MYNRCIIPEIQIKCRGKKELLKEDKSPILQQKKKENLKENENFKKKEKKIKFTYVRNY